MATLDLSEETTLPSDRYAGALAARVWRPDVDGPSVAAVREDGVFDVSEAVPDHARPLRGALAGRGAARGGRPAHRRA